MDKLLLMMNLIIKKGIMLCSFALMLQSCGSNKFLTDKHFAYLEAQSSRTLKAIPDYGDTVIPRNVNKGSGKWHYVGYQDWTSGFWPGELWYLYEATGNQKWKTEADKFSRLLTPLSQMPAIDHDLGFMVYNSFGNGYRLTGNPDYKEILLRSADTLATLFNPKVGTILSWPRPVPNMEWPQHNTIMDNMINLELLFWASKNGGSQKLYDMAVSHAEVTMKNQFRPDYTSYHVVIYDKETGKKIKAVTHQGYADNSMWARGQSWAIYGYTMCYRETKNPEFLDFAQKVTDVYLNKLPADLIPFWDFNDPDIPNAPRDASAAAVTASALLELSTFVPDKSKAKEYRQKAEKMLAELSSDGYLSKNTNSAFLLHSTGHKPNNSEVDASIIYADYYYIEALLRLKKLKEGQTILSVLK
ncbi:glycosyl hydrolase, family 88 [Arcticibacter svalbardensis MN12-7]|uniref:Glycosyl hydrolase, family 88 n=1 Tax=Arcticibacter svalbardensis MN12-7 TaxID=1150600 RepID=R9GR82_9SPHI|nr:glycoside hydrolase family 88 protein [Arcticibacter svalbardensis]EOR94357.1 glycosyl hydrolase, family 88 [Arcticibacter svalbardensis MN12-7]